MSRAQKYKPRRRLLYALQFDRRQVYIGQTVDLGRRHREHLKTWRRPFHVIPLGEMVGTHASAEEHEYAWRFVAGRQGFQVLGMTRNSLDPFLIDPRRRMNASRRRLAAGLRWPGTRKSPWPWIAAGILIAALASLKWFASIW